MKLDELYFLRNISMAEFSKIAEKRGTVIAVCLFYGMLSKKDQETLIEGLSLETWALIAEEMYRSSISNGILFESHINAICDRIEKTHLREQEQRLRLVVNK